MLVLDADSLMSAETILELARRIEADPDAGLIQTAPTLIEGRTPLARLQQFAGRVYGPLLSAGLASWCGDAGNYWGHNAIMRTGAIAASAGLPVLPGKQPFGGMILSHDFVEAALLRRAGWGVHLAADLGGSFERSPPNLIEMVTRDRRWAQGNLQHLALLGVAGLHPVNRLHMAGGALAYLASPLWLLFLLAGMALALYARPRAAGLFSGRLGVVPDLAADRRAARGHAVRAVPVAALRSRNWSVWRAFSPSRPRAASAYGRCRTSWPRCCSRR